MIRTLRFQLTAWNLVFFAVLFAALGLLFYRLLAHDLQRRLDESLIADARTAETLLRDELQEMNGDGPAAAAEVVEEVEGRASALAVFAGRQLLAASSPAAERYFKMAAPALLPVTAEPVENLPQWGNVGARGAVRRFTAYGSDFAVMAVEPLDATARDLGVVRDALWLSVPLLLAAASLGGYLLTRRGLAPLGAMAAQSRKITGESLHQRLEIGAAAEELTQLAGSFNELLARIDQSFENMRRFVQDASHELRTPLAVIRSEADVALSRDRTASEYRESLATIQEESRRLSRLVDDLLNLARADAGRIQLRLEELYLNELVADCCRSLEPLAAARGVDLVSPAGPDTPVRGDEQLLRRMVTNLLDNAIRYTPAGGKVAAAIESRDSEVTIRVADTGIGIAPEAVGQVFERFYRADQARSRQENGFGLGLSIVKWIAESHHGAVELSSQPGRGSTFTVHLQRG